MMPDVSHAPATVDRYLAELAPYEPEVERALRPGERIVMVPDLSPDAFAASAEIARRTVGFLDGAGGPLADAVRERLSSDVALHDSGFTTRLLAPLATPVHQVRSVFDGLPQESEDDWAFIAEHLDRVPAALAQYTATLREAARGGNVVARRQVLAVADQCAAWTGADDFYPTLVGRYTGTSLRARLDQGCAGAVSATHDLERFLRGELAPLAPDRDAVGDDMYALTARCFLGADIDLDDTYAFGWAELARLDARMAEVAGQIVPGGDVDAAVSFLDSDPERLLHGRAALESWLQERADGLIDTVHGRHFDIPAPGRRVECRITPATAGIMYYSPPSPDFAKPGQVWWSLPQGTDAAASASTWQAVTTLHHEAVPGHHLQFAVALGTPDLHVWQRALCHVHGYAEGWAHYSEGLADELGLVRDAGERLGMLCGQAWRAARIVIDMGLHRGLRIPDGPWPGAGQQWTVELAEQFLAEKARLDPVTARFEVTRYLGWPGQALAFKVGERLWLTAREEARQRAGGAFDLKEFHMNALRLGPMGLDPLRRALTAH